MDYGFVTRHLDLETFAETEDRQPPGAKIILPPGTFPMDQQSPQFVTQQKQHQNVTPNTVSKKPKPGAGYGFKPKNTLARKPGLSQARPVQDERRPKEIIDIDAESEGSNKRRKLNGDGQPRSNLHAPVDPSNIQHRDPYYQQIPPKSDVDLYPSTVEDDIQVISPPKKPNKLPVAASSDVFFANAGYNSVENRMNPKQKQPVEPQTQHGFSVYDAASKFFQHAGSFMGVAGLSRSQDLTQDDERSESERDRKRQRRSNGPQPEEEENPSPKIDLIGQLNSNALDELNDRYSDDEINDPPSERVKPPLTKQPPTTKSATHPTKTLANRTGVAAARTGSSKLQERKGVLHCNQEPVIVDEEEDELSLVTIPPQQAKTRRANQMARGTSFSALLSELMDEPDKSDIPSAIIAPDTKTPRNTTKSKAAVAKTDAFDTRPLLFFKTYGHLWEDDDLQIWQTLIDGRQTFSITRTSPKTSKTESFVLDRSRITAVDWAPGSEYIRITGPRNASSGTVYCIQLRFPKPKDSRWFESRIKKLWSTGVRVHERTKSVIESFMEDPLEERERLASDPVDRNMEMDHWQKNAQAREERQKPGNGIRPDASSIPKKPQLKDQLLPKTGPIPRYDSRPARQRGMPIVASVAEEGLQTRRSTRQIQPTERSAYRDSSPIVDILAPRVEVGPRWSHPVVFGPTGKKRAIVDFEDLERLNEGEFLNDNLIEFYLAWLQDKFKPEENRVHFFSTHFYSVLTSNRGKINHKAVERWTKQIDIFNYDYVIIPVNESFHWYLVVICNLPNLKRSGSDVEDDASVEVTPEKKAHTNGHNVSLASGGLRANMFEVLNPSDQKSTALPDMESITINDEENPPSSSALVSDNDSTADTRTKAREEDVTDLTISTAQSRQPNASAKKRKTRKPPPPKRYTEHEPAIVILDSLAGIHQSTSKNLKDYLIAEGAAKRGLELSKEALKCFHAKKGIPQQNNFADCGLFLCGYVEKFLQNPAHFAKKLLNQSFESEDWSINSSKMRDDIRSHLMNLHTEQDLKRQLDQEEKDRKKQELKKEKKIVKDKAQSSPGTPLTNHGQTTPPAQVPGTPPHDPRMEEKERHPATSKEASNDPLVPSAEFQADRSDDLVPATQSQSSDKTVLSTEAAVEQEPESDLQPFINQLSETKDEGTRHVQYPAQTEAMDVERSGAKLITKPSQTLIANKPVTVDDETPLETPQVPEVPPNINGPFISASNNRLMLYSNSNPFRMRPAQPKLSEPVRLAAAFKPEPNMKYTWDIQENPPKNDPVEMDLDHHSDTGIESTTQELEKPKPETNATPPRVIAETPPRYDWMEVDDVPHSNKDAKPTLPAFKTRQRTSPRYEKTAVNKGRPQTPDQDRDVKPIMQETPNGGTTLQHPEPLEHSIDSYD